jgi:hypothetical protein
MRRENFSNSFNKGMIKDIHPSLQPNNSARHAENMNIYNFDGAAFVMTTALGNEYKTKLTDGFVPLGVTVVSNVAYIISYNPTTGEGEIGMFPSPDYSTILRPQAGTADVPTTKRDYVYEYSPLYNFVTPSAPNVLSPLRSSLFNFDGRPISVTGRVNYDNSVILYMTDGVNPIKRIVTNVRVFPDYMQLSDLYYSEDDFNDLIQLSGFPDKMPNIEYVTQRQGKLPYGRYYYHVYYLSKKGIKTPIVASSAPFDVLNNPDTSTARAEPSGMDVYGTYERKSSGLSNVFRVNSLSEEYDYLRVVVEYIRDYTGERDYYEINSNYVINGSTIEIEHTFLEERMSVAPEIINELRSYSYTCNDLTQASSRLLLANIKDTAYSNQVINYLKEYVERIVVDWERVGYLMRYITSSDNTNSYGMVRKTLLLYSQFSNPGTIHNSTGYMFDECYDFAVEFILRGGVRTSAIRIGAFFTPSDFFANHYYGSLYYLYYPKFTLPNINSLSQAAADFIRDNVIAIRFLRAERQKYKEAIGLVVNMYAVNDNVWHPDARGILEALRFKGVNLAELNVGDARTDDNAQSILNTYSFFAPFPMGYFAGITKSGLRSACITAHLASRNCAFYSPDVEYRGLDLNGRSFFYKQVLDLRFDFRDWSRGESGFAEFSGTSTWAYGTNHVSAFHTFIQSSNSGNSSIYDLYGDNVGCKMAYHSYGNSVPNPLDRGVSYVAPNNNPNNAFLNITGQSGPYQGGVPMSGDALVFSPYHSIILENNYTLNTYSGLSVSDATQIKDACVLFFKDDGAGPYVYADRNVIMSYTSGFVNYRLDNDTWKVYTFDGYKMKVGAITNYRSRPQVDTLYPEGAVRSYSYISRYYNLGEINNGASITCAMGDTYITPFIYKIYGIEKSIGGVFIACFLPSTVNIHHLMPDYANNMFSYHFSDDTNIGKFVDVYMPKRVKYALTSKQSNFSMPSLPSSYFNIYDSNPFEAFRANHYPARIMHSDRQLASSPLDNYSVIRPNAYQDYDTTLGEGIAIRSWNEKLIFVQENGISLIPLDEKKAFSEDGDVIITGKSGLGEISTAVSRIYGSQHRDSVITTPMGVYGFDWRRREAWRFGANGLELLSRHKIGSFLLDKYINQYEGIGGCRIITSYDPYYRYVFFSIIQDVIKNEEGVDVGCEGFTLAFSEEMDSWVGFFSFLPYAAFAIGSDYYTIPHYTITDIERGVNNGIYHHLNHSKYERYSNNINQQVGKYYGSTYECVVRFVVNPDGYTQKVFDALTIISNKSYPVRTKYTIYDDYGQEIETEIIYNDGKPQNVVNRLANIFKYRENIVYSSIPKVKVNGVGRQRQRDKYIEIELAYRGTWTEIQGIITAYRKSMV